MNIACGVDIIEIDRIKAAIEKSGEAFLQRIYTDDERSYCEKRGAARFMSYAARFAAKEALSKAFGTGIGQRLKWREIEVIRSEQGAPSLVLHGSAAELSKERGVRDIALSLSHCSSHATAFVVLQIES